MDKFENGNHKIFWGDAIEVLENQIADNSIDLIAEFKSLMQLFYRLNYKYLVC
jgi:hypothetical protein